MKTFSHIWQGLAEFLEWEMFQIKVVDKIKTHTVWTVTFFFRKSCHLWDNVEKCGEAREAADNMAPAHCMLHNATRAHTHRRMKYSLLFHCNSGLVNAPNVMLHVYCLSCIFIYSGVSIGAVGWGTTLQDGRSHFRFPVGSLEMSRDLIFLSALSNAGVHSGSQTNEHEGIPFEINCSRRVDLTTLPSFCAEWQPNPPPPLWVTVTCYRKP
jgi:hypothetical protein